MICILIKKYIATTILERDSFLIAAHSDNRETHDRERSTTGWYAGWKRRIIVNGENDMVKPTSLQTLFSNTLTCISRKKAPAQNTPNVHMEQYRNPLKTKTYYRKNITNFEPSVEQALILRRERNVYGVRAHLKTLPTQKYS